MTERTTVALAEELLEQDAGSWNMLDRGEAQAADSPSAFEPSIYCPQPVLCKGNGACATKCGGNVLALADITSGVTQEAAHE